MPDALSKSLDLPDNVIEFPGMLAHIVELGDLTVGQLVSEPGLALVDARSPHRRRRVVPGSPQSLAVLSGRFWSSCGDGTELEFGPNDVFDIPPEHDGFTVGDERCVQIEWSGIRTFAGFPDRHSQSSFRHPSLH